MLKYRSSIVTDMPVQLLAYVFGPMRIVGEVYVTRSYPSRHRLKTLLGTAQSMVQRRGYSSFAAKIFPAYNQFPVQRKEYRKEPVKHTLDYGIPLNAFFYDRQAAMPELFPEEQASFQRWLRPDNNQPLTGSDIRTILRYWETVEPRDFAYYVHQLKGAGYSIGEIKQWIDGLYMLQSLPKYQAATHGSIELVCANAEYFGEESAKNMVQGWVDFNKNHSGIISIQKPKEFDTDYFYMEGNVNDIPVERIPKLVDDLQQNGIAVDMIHLGDQEIKVEAAQGIAYPPIDQQLSEAMPQTEPLVLPTGGQSMNQLDKLLQWIDMHSDISDEEIKNYVFRASGMDVPIDKIQPFIARLRMMKGRTNSSVEIPIEAPLEEPFQEPPTVIYEDIWYDKGTRSWVKQFKDVEGNQVGEAEFTHKKPKLTGNPWPMHLGA